MKRKLAFLGAILLAAFIFTYEGNTYQTHALDEEDQAWIEEARGALQNIVEDREVMALVYLCDDLTIRAEAAEDSTKWSPCPVDRWWRSGMWRWMKTIRSGKSIRRGKGHGLRGIYPPGLSGMLG